MQAKPVQTKTQVLNLLKEYQQELHHFGVKSCGIFGSFARDTAIHDRSDVDILVTFEPDQKTFDNFMHLSFFLEDIFGRAVDLITIEGLSPHIGSRILDEVEYVSLGS
jgi:predicted nucleotidyltransferase